jgi:hypothetical protein
MFECRNLPIKSSDLLKREGCPNIGTLDEEPLKPKLSGET